MRLIDDKPSQFPLLDDDPDTLHKLGAEQRLRGDVQQPRIRMSRGQIFLDLPQARVGASAICHSSTTRAEREIGSTHFLSFRVSSLRAQHVNLDPVPSQSFHLILHQRYPPSHERQSGSHIWFNPGLTK